jgi:hypothetical protein
MSRGAPGTGCGLYLEPAGMRTPVGTESLYRATFASVEQLNRVTSFSDSDNAHMSRTDSVETWERQSLD